MRRAKLSGKRFLDCSDKGIHAEVSFVGEIQGSGRLAGIDGRIVGTDDFWEKLTGEVATGTACGVFALRDEFIAFKAVGLGSLSGSRR